ncbi:hypothetical protein JI752_019125 [Lysobacter sp. MMG2]|uniref:hypothetical protein n=1 Tax=Lysobacter sp. MMG2 TaxID=2801338 RepID=UPI001C229B64|nr:hypothetical protein [Lysobacter sp. MMG2]MBU8978264.1 hypothetical protein [Lysobacter sp. MMG2]
MRHLNRLPTKSETYLGGLFALLLSSGLGYLFWYVFRAASERPDFLTPSIVGVLAVLAVIFAWSSGLLLRILFGSPRLPSFKGQAATGYLMVSVGIGLCTGSLLSANNRAVLYFAQGICAITLGLFWAAQARRAARVAHHD